jgi:hypothetical protein
MYIAGECIRGGKLLHTGLPETKDLMVVTLCIIEKTMVLGLHVFDRQTNNTHTRTHTHTHTSHLSHSLIEIFIKELVTSYY